MLLELYEHNRQAYDRAIGLLQNEGKAAIIHPTGTGKTFIAFKLCEDNPSARILWLSPGDYIFKTQLESAKRNGFEPKNIIFYTYAKLTYTTDEEIDELLPDYIILDEFHRAGATEWGKRVNYLLERYAEVPVLGLSATNIRYLDGQRDMADEIFEGNIASQMTLGEAIVRGILLPPTYITAIYSCAKDLKKYERRVKTAKSAATRDAAQKYLDSLRRAIDMADGLDEIFAKYITNSSGKFIIFCPDRQEMNKLINLSTSMFGKVNSDIHTYIVYSEDPTTDKQFAAFKGDNSQSLKLLYSIDMLNEGVHVPDVDGVVLFRPTVSPIIYKQQIGRALSASKDKQPVIFDIVNNFENLYSIGTIQNEMDQAVGYYRLTGQNDLIINDRFTLIDEAKECRQLFDNLEQTLTVSWNTMYSFAREYYALNGNLNVPRRYKTPQGYSLGNWLTTQRKVRKGLAYGILTDERIDMLDSIGMVWESFHDLRFEYGFEQAQKYAQEYGNLDVPATYKTQGGFALGTWVFNASRRKFLLSQDKIDRLNSIGIIWDKKDSKWQQNFQKAKAYYATNGNLNVPAGYVTDDGFNLYCWISDLRRRKDKLTAEQIELLNSIGFCWKNKFDNAWDSNYQRLVEYKAQHGNVNVPIAYEVSGVKLGVWLSRQRSAQAKLTDEQRKKLEGLGVSLDREESWEVRYRLAKEYFDEHGNLNMSATYKVDGIWLGTWISRLRSQRSGLTAEQIERLNAIGMVWNVDYTQWLANFEEAKAYSEQFGNLNVSQQYKTPSGFALGVWLQRQKNNRDKLDDGQITLLESIGFSWQTVSDREWERNYQLLREYVATNGNANVPVNYSVNGVSLGRWLVSQKSRKDKLSPERRLKLINAGVVFERTDIWEVNYRLVRDYYAANGNLDIPVRYSVNGVNLYSWLYEQKLIYNGKRGNRSLSPDKVKRLEAIGIRWN